MILLHVGHPMLGTHWQAAMPALLPGLEVRQWPDAGDLAEIEYLVAYSPPAELLGQMPALKAVFSIGAGVDHVDVSCLPPHVPVVRMVQPFLSDIVADFTVMAVLALHRGLPGYVAAQARQTWAPLPSRAASTRRVGVMGPGAIGRATLARLAAFGFPLSAWGRSPFAIPGVAAYVGADGLAPFLAQSDILVCLLPLTDATRGMLNATLFAALPTGAGVVNVGRGAHLVAEDLIAALDSGQIGAAFLDVADPEPPPPGHPFWAHPAIMLTPHVAGALDLQRCAETIVANIRRQMAGEPMEGEMAPTDLIGRG